MPSVPLGQQVSWGCRGSPGQPVLLQLSPRSCRRGRAVLGWQRGWCCPTLHAPGFQGCSAHTAGLLLCYRELCPANFPTSAPQRAGDGGCLGHGR